MRGSSLFLICAVFFFAPRSAGALPPDTTFELSLMDGPDPDDATKVATITFRPIEDPGDGTCRYSAGWTPTDDNVLATSCSVNEQKTHEHASCEENAGGAFATTIVKPPDSACAGIDSMGRIQDIFLMVGVVLPGEPYVIGLLQWTAGGPFVYGFSAEPE